MREVASRPLNDAMLMLAKQPNALFIGQNVAYSGTSMYHDLDGVPMEQRIEFPVAEELQLGASIGLALQGYLPVSIFPRMDFLMRAMDQLINHLDKLDRMSRGQYQPKVIIRTRIGSKTPLDAGPQHTQDHFAALRRMVTNVLMIKVINPSHAMEAYQFAARQERSTIVVEAL